MIYSNDYLSFVGECYDLSDPYTREKVIFCQEADQQSNIEHYTNKLYNDIKSGVDDIDYGTIPLSKGDITKIDNYENLVQCVNTISALIKEYHQPTTQIDVISTAIENIQKRTRVWEKAFGMNIEFPIIMYNTMTLSIVASVSLLITTCIEYIKNGDGTIDMAFDKASYLKSRSHVLFDSLEKFNLSCSKGICDKLCDGCIKQGVSKIKESYELSNGEEPIDEFVVTAVGIGAVVVTLLSWRLALDLIIFCLRRSVWYFFSFRQNAADYFTTQAEFLQMNAENLKYRIADEDQRKKVYDKQIKWVDRFKKFANFFMIKDKRAQADAKKKEEESKREKRTENDDDDSGDGGIF